MIRVKSKTEKQAERLQKQGLITTAAAPPDSIYLDKQLESTAEKQLEWTAAQFVEKPDSNLAKKLVSLSLDLSNLYAEKILGNVDDAIRGNEDSELWRLCFYAIVESLRKTIADKQTKTQQKIELTRISIDFITEGIQFYENLLYGYEQVFNVDLDDIFYWPATGIPSSDLAEAVPSKDEQQIQARKRSEKAILRLAQRLFISLGDLHRYKALVEGEDNYSGARVNYLRASQIDPSNGRTFNQLGVLASYSRRKLDEVFFYLRALCVRFPFVLAREALELTLHSIRQYALKYEKDLLEQKSKENGPDIRRKLEHIQEVWIMPNESVPKLAEAILGESDENLFDSLFAGKENAKSQKRASLHLVHTAGILISGIGTENFAQSAKLALDELSAFLAAEDCQLSPMDFLQIAFVSIVPAHYSRLGATQMLVETQHKLAMDYVLAVFGRLVNFVRNDLGNVGLYLIAGRVTKKFERAMPALSLIAHWISKPQILARLSAARPSPLWPALAEVATELQRLEDIFQLAKCTFEVTENDDHSVDDVLLPEILLVSPFFEVFPATVNPVRVEDPPMPMIQSAGRYSLANHARFSALLLASHKIAELNLEFFKFDEVLAKFTGKELSARNDQQPQKREDAWEEPEEEEETRDESELKKQLLLDEEISSKQNWLVEVRPKYLVPDTNAFIDHLAGIKRIADSKLFTLLIPTTVIDELNQLALGTFTGRNLLPRDLLISSDSKWAYREKQAKASVEYLKAITNQRTPNVATVTSNGNILQKISFAYESTEMSERTNDDRILAVCVRLVEKLCKNPVPSSVGTSAQNKVGRSVVLLTEDRGMVVKAIAEKVPVRTIPSFIKLAGI